MSSQNPNIFTPPQFDDGFKQLDSHLVKQLAQSAFDDKKEVDNYKAYTNTAVGSDALTKYCQDLLKCRSVWEDIPDSVGSREKKPQPVAVIAQNDPDCFASIGLVPARPYYERLGSCWYLDKLPNVEFLLYMSVGQFSVKVTNNDGSIQNDVQANAYDFTPAAIHRAWWDFNKDTGLYEVRSVPLFKAIAFGEDAIKTLPEFPTIASGYETLMSMREEAKATTW